MEENVANLFLRHGSLMEKKWFQEKSIFFSPRKPFMAFCLCVQWCGLSRWHTQYTMKARENVKIRVLSKLKKSKNQSLTCYNKLDYTTPCLCFCEVRAQAEVDVPVTGWVGCPPACGIYWGSRTGGPPIEFSTTFQPAPSPASVSCR